MLFRDLWYFLYSSTDKEFRDQHLNDVLRDYYDNFSRYLVMEEVHVSLEDFCQEMNSTRLGIGLGTGMFILFVLMCPDTLGGK